MNAIVPEVTGALLRRVAAGALCFLALGASAQSRPMASLAVAQPPGAPAPAYDTPPPQPMAESRLESLGMGDMVRVTVFRNPDLTTEARVSERGTILFPMVGEIPVAGLTPSQAGARLAEKLRSGRFVVNPEVTVSLAQVNSRQVSVLGNVNKPGRYPLDSTNVRLRPTSTSRRCSATATSRPTSSCSRATPSMCTSRRWSTCTARCRRAAPSASSPT